MNSIGQWPRLSELQSLIEKRYRLSRPLVIRALVDFGPIWAQEFEAILASQCPDTESLESAVKGYSAFAFDSMRRQKAFEQTLQYPNKTYAEAAQEVYFNEAHMMREYLPGLLLSHFLWPHHYRQLQFFDTAFVGQMALSEVQKFAEIGVGTAIYTRRILSRLGRAEGVGFDISPSSCAFAKAHLSAAGLGPRFAMRQQDVVLQPMEPMHWMVCVEVLEHLEDPVGFLKALRGSLAVGGKAFITAAINAAHADHIHLYRNSEEVWHDLEAAGFRLEQSFTAAAYAPPAQGVPVPVAAAFVVT
jgi:2-polyprenyl-3-methyl-5-hydroxy-6-metoxy-1,4-benzoquinol methylase